MNKEEKMIKQKKEDIERKPKGKKFLSFAAIASGLGIIVCIYKKEIYLAFQGFLILLFWIMMLLEDKPINKNKVMTKIAIVTIIVLIILSILEKFSV